MRSPEGYYQKDEWLYPSVTKIIRDCTNNSEPLIQWGANQVVLWIRANTALRSEGTIQEPIIYHAVLDEHLEQARFAYKETSQAALDVGSEVHGKIELYLNDQLKGLHPSGYNFATALKSEQAQNAFIAFLKWAEDHKIKPIALEQTVFGDSFGGTLDFLGYFDGKLYVIDWKSSKAFYPEMRYQVAAYRSAVEKQEYFKHFDSVLVRGDNYKPKIPAGCGVLRLDKETGIPEWKDTSKTYEKDLAVFEAMLKLYMLKHPRVAKKANWGNNGRISEQQGNKQGL